MEKNKIIKTNTILDQFVDNNLEIIRASSKLISLAEIKKKAKTIGRDNLSLVKSLSFKKKLGQMGLIAEIKKSSPSTGAINVGIDVNQQAKLYEKSGASGISVLTQPLKFAGSLNDLKQVKNAVHIPVLRKDFIIDPYQIYEAKITGASAVLLIVMILEQKYLQELFDLTKSLGMDVLIETHNKAEIEIALKLGASLIGVNARDLRTLKVNLKTVELMLPQIPKNKIRIAESGIFNIDDVRRVRKSGADAILVGSSIMSAKNPKEKIKELLEI